MQGSHNNSQSNQIKPPKWFFWPLWVLVSALGWAIGAIICDIIGIGATNISRPSLFAEVISEPIYGVAIGTLQWLVLRRSLPRSGSWILAWIVGLLVAGLVVQFIATPISYMAMSSAYLSLVLTAIVSGIVGGVIGVAQWGVLRRHVRSAILWIPFAIFATSMSDVARDIVFSPLWFLLPSLLQYLAIATSGALAEVVMGLLLIWLLENSASKQAVQQSIGVSP